ncbi:hypothetical protein FIBSPDRAFT_954207 [Athelia psychrophila]|uniref:RNase III domain-containing protein n=1 Tax=Athelia psychrophila TaxID=1759441 RepID=A0A166JEB0_9AGAM|nr:hypothetical protein FIBSPDRAFT_954207 [Fibularhizoctonia sp. CBS 109695]
MRCNANGLLFSRAQMKLLEAISKPSCDFKPPRILQDEDDELEIFQAARGTRKDSYYQVLELIGDAAMHLSVVMVLRKMYPGGSSEIFTHLRSAVNSNKTFFFLMKKAGLSDDSATTYDKCEHKYISNGFEIRIGILILQEGLPFLNHWVEKAFGPLIRACMPDMLQIKADAANAADAAYNMKRSRENLETEDEDALPSASKKLKIPVLIQVQPAPPTALNKADESQSQHATKSRQIKHVARSERRLLQRKAFESNSPAPVGASSTVSGNSADLGPTRVVKTDSSVSKENLGHSSKNTDQDPTREQVDSDRPRDLLLRLKSLNALHRDLLSCLPPKPTLAVASWLPSISRGGIQLAMHARLPLSTPPYGE